MAQGTILDNEPRVSIDDPGLLEGDSGTATMTFNVTLQAPYDVPVTIQYATADGTATAGSDYAAASGTVTFAPGETLKTIAIAVNGDRLLEDDETVLVDITTPDIRLARRSPRRYAAFCRRTSASGICSFAHSRSNTRS